MVQFYISPLFLYIGTTTLVLHSSCIFYVVSILLKSLVDQIPPTSYKHFQASIRMSYGLVAFSIFICFNAFLTSTIPILPKKLCYAGKVSSLVLMSPTWFLYSLYLFLVNGKLDDDGNLHLSLISLYFTRTFWSLLLIHLPWS